MLHVKRFTSKTQQIGETGENLACLKIKKLGFTILERNYTKQGGEIDIVAKKSNSIHFIEVKAVSCENLASVTHGTYSGYRPEENLSFHKFIKISKTIDLYLLENNVSDETSWQVDLATVYIDTNKKQGIVKLIENIII